MFNLQSLFLVQLATLGDNFVSAKGVSVLMDEVSGELDAAYFKSADAVGGFCHEHVSSVNTRLHTIEDALALATALDNGTVHIGKEISVIAIQCLGKSLHGAFSILMSPTCKSETPEETAKLFHLIKRLWNVEFAHRLGKIRSFASDGDARRWQMVHESFMQCELTATHPLYKHLGWLKGFNGQMGEGDVTGDFDWRHELKRELHLITFKHAI